MSRKWTIAILVTAAAVLIGWDIYVAVASPPDTISLIVNGFAGDHPILPFGLGVIFGHLFWPLR